jgi:hypothetical protein
MHYTTPQIGIFWFHGERRQCSKFLGISRRWKTSPVVNGTRSLGLAHDKGWCILQKLNPEIQGFAFDYFPRGKLIWDQSNDHWRLLVDQKLLRGAFVTTVVLDWKIPRQKLIVTREREYRSSALIGLPAF